MSKTAPYGQWESPIDAELVVSKTIVFSDVLVDPKTNVVYHLEERPDDHGRCVIVKTGSSTDPGLDVLPSPYSARTFVQEYGGAPAIVYNDTIYFSNPTLPTDPSKPDNGIYAIKVGEEVATRVTPPDKPLLRYANFAVHPQNENLLVTLQEDHTDDNDPDHPQPGKVVNRICVVDTTTATVNPIILPTPADFYATPVLNPSGNKIAWQEWNLAVAPWNLPGMPWDSGSIYVADVVVDSGGLKLTSAPVLVAGKGAGESAAAAFPTWITDTTLVYTTDEHNKYQNPYIYHTDSNPPGSTPVLKTPLKQDFAEPAWYLGLYPYAILGGKDGKYGVFTAFESGANILYIVNLTEQSEPVLIPFDDPKFTVAQHVRAASENTFVFTGSRASYLGGVVQGTVQVSDESGYTVTFDVLKYSADPEQFKTLKLEKYISTPDPRMLTGSGGHPIYVVYYPPYNEDYPNGSSIPGEKPPCILNVHGGPTGLEPQALNWIKMFYTSRGFAWLDVNYRGSSGYGRDYIDSLNGYWGRYDVEDCKEAANILAEQDIDGQRVAIRGGSAGAYTTLSSVTFAADSTYKTACAAYGCVADVQHLTDVTEKFEMRYIYTLFSSAPDGGAWDPRNPIDHASNVKIPLLMLQGLADGVVPPKIVFDFVSQITSAKKAPSGEFMFYLNEGHHWHLALTIKNALANEHQWYLDTLLPV